MLPTTPVRRGSVAKADMPSGFGSSSKELTGRRLERQDSKRKSSKSSTKKKGAKEDKWTMSPNEKLEDAFGDDVDVYTNALWK